MSDPLADTLAVRKAREAGYSDAEIADHLQQTTPQVQQARQAGYQDSEIVDHLAAPPQDDSRAHAFLLGITKPIDNLAQMAMHIPGAATVDRVMSHALGIQGTNASAERNDLRREGNPHTGYQTLGNIAGTLPVAELRGGPIVQGAAAGALLSDKHTGLGLATDAAMGAIGSLAGAGIAKGLGAIARPITNKAAVALHDAGIELSPGQLLQSTGSAIGKAVRGAEDKARSVPILGSLISASRDRATNAVNHAAANDVLSTIGKKVPSDLPAGHDLMDAVETSLSSRYQQVVPHLVGHLDQQFADDLGKAKASTNVLPTNRQKQFQTIVQDVFGNRAQGGAIRGQDLKDAESRLTLLAGQYSRSQDADQKILGDSLYKVRQALRDMAVRSDPSGSDLQAINQGWAKLQQLRKAANVNGVVLPSALARQANKTGHGTDFARSASLLLPDHVPNSGSADRYMQAKALSDMASGIVGSGAAVGGAVAGHAGTAGAGTALTLAAMAPYTKLGSHLLNRAAFASRPALVQKFGSLAQYAARGAPVAVPALLAHK